MVAIGRALMARPKLVLLDEPSLGLAPRLVREIFDIIKRLNEETKTTFLVVEQNAMVALSIAHYGYVMENGRIVLEGPVQTLLNNEDVKEFYLGLTERGAEELPGGEGLQTQETVVGMKGKGAGGGAGGLSLWVPPGGEERLRKVLAAARAGSAGLAGAAGRRRHRADAGRRGTGCPAVAWQALPVLRKELLGSVQAESPPFGGLLGEPVEHLARIFVSPGDVYDPQGTDPDYWRFGKVLAAAGSSGASGCSTASATI